MKYIVTKNNYFYKINKNKKIRISKLEFIKKNKINGGAIPICSDHSLELVPNCDKNKWECPGKKCTVSADLSGSYKRMYCKKK
jgi:hypothetical protein